MNLTEIEKYKQEKTKKYMREYYLKNKEKLKARTKAYYLKNKLNDGG